MQVKVADAGRAVSPSRRNRPSALLLALALVLFFIAEPLARFGISHVSKIYRRIAADRAGILKLRHAAPGKPPTIAFLGNSLLLEALDMRLLREGLQGRYTCSRFVVEQTSYYDWYYGLARLFREGFEPDIVVLSLNAPQMISNTTRGDYSARGLFDVGDIPQLAAHTTLDLTTATSLIFAHYSAFYAARSELRTILLGRLFPAVPRMLHDFTTRAAIIPPDRELIPLLLPRLIALKELSKTHGANFVFLNTPTPQPGDQALVQAGSLAGVRVLRPVPNYGFSPAYYSDGFHLNATGSRLFTSALVAEIDSYDITNFRHLPK